MVSWHLLYMSLFIKKNMKKFLYLLSYDVIKSIIAFQEISQNYTLKTETDTGLFSQFNMGNVQENLSCI